MCKLMVEFGLKFNGNNKVGNIYISHFFDIDKNFCYNKYKEEKEESLWV